MEMTIKEIDAKQARQGIKFEVAKKIRELLDAARKQYGAEDWDSDDMETEALELVTETE